MFFDCHLMVDHPETYIEDFAAAGADQIVVHAEATKHLHRCIQAIHAKGIKAGVALNPASSLALIEEILPDVDMVLLMTVNPGFGGQQFISSVLPKISGCAGCWIWPAFVPTFRWTAASMRKRPDRLWGRGDGACGGFVCVRGEGRERRGKEPARVSACKGMKRNR